MGRPNLHQQNENKSRSAPYISKGLEKKKRGTCFLVTETPREYACGYNNTHTQGPIAEIPKKKLSTHDAKDPAVLRNKSKPKNTGEERNIE